MRNTFLEYYRLTQEEFETLWDNCFFCFDTNVLLDVYRYTPDTRKRLVTILNKLQDRIWIPFQVGKEFHTNRLSVIRTQEVPYDQISSKVGNAVKNLKTQISKLVSLEARRPHPFIDTHKIFGILDNAVDQVESALQQTQESHPNLLQEDPLLTALSELFDGKVGGPYEQNELDEKYKEVQFRYECKMPPGYKDRGPKGIPVKGSADPRAYGDAIVWFQILDFAMQKSKPIIFITSDIKEDWWLEIKGEVLGPRPEMIREMKQKAGVDYYQYNAETFLKRAEKYLNLEPDPQAIDEIRVLRLRDEELPAAQALRMAERMLELARSQLEIEEQMSGLGKELNSVEHQMGAPYGYITPDQAIQISQAVKAVAVMLSKTSGRNEYGGVYGELYRKFGITSYKLLPAGRFKEVTSWLSEWQESIEGDDPF